MIDASWIQRLPDIRRTLRSLPDEAIDRGKLEVIFGVKRRQAVELMKKFGGVGHKGKLLLKRTALLALMDSYAGESTTPVSTAEVIPEEERLRRTQFQARMQAIKEDWKTRREMLITAPAGITRTRLKNIPGVTLEPGRITIEFRTAEEGVKKLLLLGMALRNDYAEFEEAVQLPDSEEQAQIDEVCV